MREPCSRWRGSAALLHDQIDGSLWHVAVHYSAHSPERTNEGPPVQYSAAVREFWSNKSHRKGRSTPAFARRGRRTQPAHGPWHALLNDSVQVKRLGTIQRWADDRGSFGRGLPEDIKGGVERLSGYAMDDVTVHYRSDKPARLNARAYAQGSQIHLAAGQEQHLAHEAWHVVQQKQGRVRTDTSPRGTVAINDAPELEREADTMGERVKRDACRFERTPANPGSLRTVRPPTQSVVQCLPDREDLYWRRLRATAEGPGLFNPVLPPRELVDWVLDNPTVVGPGIADAVRAEQQALQANPDQLRQVIREALEPRLAAPGQYHNDVQHNALLTKVLKENDFVDSVISGNLHADIPNTMGEPYQQGPIALVEEEGVDDRALEAIDLFNRITAPAVNLPSISIESNRHPHAAMDHFGTLHLGWAAARSTILHELGHHLENNLGPAQFVTLHNFLAARTRTPPPGTPETQMTGMREHVGYRAFGREPGYDIDMPRIQIGASRHNGWLHRNISLYPGLVVSGIRQGIGRMWGKILAFPENTKQNV